MFVCSCYYNLCEDQEKSKSAMGAWATHTQALNFHSLQMS